MESDRGEEAVPCEASEGNEPSVERLIHGLTQAVNTFTSRAEDIRKATEVIMQQVSLNKTDENNLPRVKIEALVTLAGLYDSAAARFRVAEARLKDRQATRELLADVRLYLRFLADQLASEEQSARRLLLTLRTGRDNEPEELV